MAGRGVPERFTRSSSARTGLPGKNGGAAFGRERLDIRSIAHQAGNLCCQELMVGSNAKTQITKFILAGKRLSDAVVRSLPCCVVPFLPTSERPQIGAVFLVLSTAHRAYSICYVQPQARKRSGLLFSHGCMPFTTIVFFFGGFSAMKL